MSESLSLEDIYKLFEKTNEKFEQSRLEYDLSIKEIAAEAERSMAELRKTVDSLTTRWGNCGDY